MIDPRIEPSTPFTGEQLLAIEQTIGRPLPEDYKAFARTYGAAFLGGCVDGNEEFQISGLTGSDEILQTLAFLTNYRNAGLLPVATCVLGGHYLLDCNGGGAVYFIIIHGGRRTEARVADSFGEMIARIVVKDAE